jgi:hypothetical protein
MQRKLWSEDPKEILELFNAVIGGRLTVMLQGRQVSGLRTRIQAIHRHRNIPYLLLVKPQGLTDARFVRDVLLKMKGLPVLGFSCPITREADNLLATMIPQAVFQLELRSHARLVPLQGSMATFFTRGGSRVSICMMEDICMGGVKLTGAFAQNLAVNDVVGPCTLSLAGRDALISREVTVNKAKIIRLEDGAKNTDQRGIGIKFELEDYEEVQLHEHIDFLSGQ